MRRIFQLVLALLALAVFCDLASAQDKVVYHIDDAATFTPSGVVRIGQLQSREIFAYIKP